MRTVAPAPGSPTTAAASTRRGWSWPHYLACLAVPILILETWTVVGWLTDGPWQVTEFREPHSANWYAARAFEGAALLVAVLVVIHVVRGCMRERRVLTFDLMFCLCGATLTWTDLAPNFVNPVLLTSSNFTNLNNMCGHLPLVINPDCGRVPEPIPFWWLLETFGLLGGAIVAAAALRWSRSRWPGLTTRRVLGLILLAGLAVELLTEGLAAVLGLWIYQTNDAISLRFGHGLRYSHVVAVIGAVFFAVPVAIRFFRDDRGLTVVERGVNGYRPRVAKGISLLALYAVFQIAAFGTSIPYWVLGQYESPWRKMPAYLVNDVCNAPGVSSTRYGTCPGDAGYRMPGRHSLPGRSP